MNQKIINNAISAYFGLGMLLLLPSTNENIQDQFVKKHAQIATYIHLGFFLNYIIFISYNFLGTIHIFDWYINHIIASVIFLGLFGFLLYGGYKASRGETFQKGEISQITKMEHLIHVKESNLNEEGILTITLSLIPIIGFVIRGKFYNYKSPIINNNIKLNFFITTFLSILFVLGHSELLLLFLLLYLIFVTFFGLFLLFEKNIVALKLDKIPNMEELYVSTQGYVLYLKKYFHGTFTPLHACVGEAKKYYLEDLNKHHERIQNLGEPKFSLWWSYFPFLNLFLLLDLESKNRYHILNGVIITIISSIIIGLERYEYFIFVILITAFNIGYQKRKYYKIYFLWDFFEFFVNIILRIGKFGKKIQKDQEVSEISFK